ncbi:MAG TPA: caspase family protein [Thermoanaerobaculia bacterium]|nr:caspase family protein [Thermoanaerobaculia bacterium]
MCDKLTLKICIVYSLFLICSVDQLWSQGEHIVIDLDPPKLDFTTTEPLNTEVRVALLIPASLRARNPTWHHYVYSGTTHKENDFEIDLASLLSGTFTNAVTALFPKTTLVSERPDASSFDVLFVVSWSAEPIIGEYEGPSWITVNGESALRSNYLDRLRVNVSITIEDNAGTAGEPMEFSAVAETTERSWSHRTATRKKMDHIVRSLVPQLLKIRRAPGLQAIFAKYEFDHSFPCNLVLLGAFSDNEGLRPNGRLDAGEQASVRVKLENRGPGPAFDTEVRLSTTTAGVLIGEASIVDRLEPNQAVEFDIPIKSAVSLAGDRLLVLLEAREKRSFGAKPLELAIQVGALEMPQLEIASVACIPSSACGGGQDHLVVGAGTEFEIEAWVRNKGAGFASQVRVAPRDLPADVELLTPAVTLPIVEPLQAARVRFRLRTARIPKASATRALVVAQDGRGKEVGYAERILEWHSLKREPRFSLEWAIHDGTLAGSTGNKDGIISNGEVAILEVRVANNGNLDARNLSMAITAVGSHPTIKPSLFELGVIPAESQTASVAVTLEFPRAFTPNSGERSVLLVATLKQDDFGDRRISIELPFFLRRPQLEARYPTEVAVNAGERVKLPFVLTNRGSLGASAVLVSAESLGPGIDLVTTSDRHTSSAQLTVGDLAAGRDSAEGHFVLAARSGVTTRTGRVRITVQQADFAPQLYEISVAVQPQAASRVEIPAGAEIQGGQRSSGPIIILQGPRERDLSGDPATVLEFLVLDSSRTRNVQVNHNGKPLTIGNEMTQVLADNPGWRFTVPVRLQEGVNQFTVSVIGEDGHTADASKEVSWAPSIGLQDAVSFVIETELPNDALSGARIAFNGIPTVLTRVGDRSYSLNFLGAKGKIEAGLNVIDIAAKTATAARERLLLFAECGVLKPVVVPYDRSYAVIAAIDDYDRTRDPAQRRPTGYQRLRGMVDRAEELRRVLERLGFPRQHIFTLYNEKATSVNIEATLKEFWAGGKYANANRLLFYFGGHGDGTSGGGFLVTYDFEPSRPTATSFLMSDIPHRHFQQVRAHHFLVALDSCSAGLAVPGFTTLGSSGYGGDVVSCKKQSILRADTESPARNLLVAGTGEQRALSENGGIFTRALVTGLQGAADFSRDGIIQLEELSLFVRNEVVAQASLSRVRQEPFLYEASELGHGRMLFLLRQP